MSGETLHGVIQEPLDKIRIGRIRPASVHVRMLLPDTTRPIVLPCRADDLSDDPEFRSRMTRITTRHSQAIIDSVHELATLGIVAEATAEIRAHPCAPLFKLYILNGEEAFFGLYPILRHPVQLPSGTHDFYDLMGKDAMVFHHSIHREPDRHALHRARQCLVRLHVGHHQLRVPCMTASPPAGAAADEIIARTRYLLLDFDGPICDIYAGLADLTVADRLRKLITGIGVAIPDGLRQTPDPLAVFIYSATVSAELAARVESEMTEQELAAVPTARPTAYVHDVITSCRESGRPVAVVSNNSARAVHAYLALHGLDDRVDLVVARTTPDPALLKPSSRLLDQAVAELRAQPAECVLVGDSVTDIQAGRAASVHTIGYANRLSKHDRLTAAGATAIITSLADLVIPLRANPLPN